MTSEANVMARERADVGSYEDIVAAAERTTGMTDMGGTAHEEGLRILVEDLNSAEAGLTGKGNYFQRSEVKSALVGRFLTQAQFNARPEHVEVPIERPIFVMGLPRTGTTALHRLLHADPMAQGLEMWITQYPQPRPPRPPAPPPPHLGERPDLRRDAAGLPGPSHRVPGVPRDPLHGRHLGRGVL